MGQTSCGEHRKTNPKISQGHVCRVRFTFELFVTLTFRYQNSCLTVPQAVDCLDSTSCDRMQGSFKLRDLQP